MFFFFLDTNFQTLHASFYIFNALSSVYDTWLILLLNLSKQERKAMKNIRILLPQMEVMWICTFALDHLVTRLCLWPSILRSPGWAWSSRCLHQSGSHQESHGSPVSTCGYHTRRRFCPYLAFWWTYNIRRFALLLSLILKLFGLIHVI